MTEEEREAVAREMTTHPVSQREEQWAAACELQAKLAAARETKAYIRLIETWMKTKPPCFTHPLNPPFF